VKPSDGIEPSTPSWLLCYLEVRDRATIDDAALVTSCLLALGGDRRADSPPEQVTAVDEHYDKTGMRMGWGRGYYDKTLGSMEKCPPVYAVVFDNEFVDEVPREVHDQPVNGLVTPTRIISF